jgi:oxygen-independent coproporphyrinogen-3 oxidase
MDAIRDDTSSPLADAALLARYPLGGTSYTSFPAPDCFGPQFGAADALRQLQARGSSDAGPLALHVHQPFCDALCYYCTCDTIVTRERERATEYLLYLEREIMTQRGALGREEEAAHLHWGGGTPAVLSIDDMARVMDTLRACFRFVPDCDCSIEVDPRRVDAAAIERLAALGFNAMTIGVQDFDSGVQASVNRSQSVEQTSRAMLAARSCGFRSVGIDLIYGLPRQGAASAARTLKSVLALMPDRIALYQYVHLPELHYAQRRIDPSQLPSPAERALMLAGAIEGLAAAGYVHTGMDHFALPGGELGRAPGVGAFQPDYQGYSMDMRGDRLAFGMSAISAVGGAYFQNHRLIDDYYRSLERGELPVHRGHRLDLDDQLRREAIRQLACDFRLRIDELEGRFGIDFARHFRHERARLHGLERDGLVQRTGTAIEVTPRGRLLVRHVCAVFDRYLRESPSHSRSRFRESAMLPQLRGEP